MSNERIPTDDAELVDQVGDSVRKHELSADVQRRLRLARAEAVAHVEAKRSSANASLEGGRWLFPAGGAAAALVLAMFLIQEKPTPPMPEFDEQEFAAASEMDMLEDIEFLAWMLEEVEQDVPDDT